MTRPLTAIGGSKLPPDWADVLQAEFVKPHWAELNAFLETAGPTGFYPPSEHVFAAFAECRFNAVRVVILGQDPYHQPRQANGLAFSVGPETPVPPSLRKIFKLLTADGFKHPEDGDLTGWARQGVLLLNTALTVEPGRPGSHRHLWNGFADAVVDAVNAKPTKVAFLLWGQDARRRAERIDGRHLVVEAAHPAARANAADPFLKSRSFALAHEFVRRSYPPAITWN